MSGPPRHSIVRATWWALLAPRRLIPIVVVCAPLVVVQGAYSGERSAVLLAAVMCVTFVALAPVSYRVLFPDGLDLSHGAVRLLLYAIIGAGVVLTVAVALPKALDLGPSFLANRYTLMVSVAMFLVGGWGLGRDIGYEQRVIALQRAADEAQLLALKAHLDPHFLFNTLNAIAEWCRQDGVVAEAAVLQLSQMLRTVLAGVKESRWPLERELELVRTLFALHLLRDEELFTVVEKLPDPLPAVQVPPMVLLTLAENAVKHGPGAGHRGRLELTVSASSDGVRLELENPGAFMGPRAGSDGLPTLARRLALAYEGRARLRVGPATDPGRTRAELWLPL